MLELAEVAEKYPIARISSMLRRDDYNKYIKGISPWRELDDPYFMCFYQIIDLAADFVYQMGEHTTTDTAGFEIAFIFDEQGAIGLRALEWWEVHKEALKHERPHLCRFLISPPIFQSDRKFLPLQAADLYAWHVRRIFFEGDDHIRTRAVIEALKGVPAYGGYITGEQMLEGLPELTAISERYRPKP